MKYYNTEILNHNGKIFLISDIHGDIHSFIISLRDCAKVIKKYKKYNKDILDSQIEKNLLIDINQENNNYDESFGYKWCGKNSYIIICGDTIDPKRSNSCIREDGKICTEYPQVEIKLLKLINYLNKKAKKHGGYIFKLLGNHELMNILGITQRGELDIFDSDKNLENYYKGISRENSFNVGQPGFKLLFKGGCGMLIKINNTIGVHGKLYGTINEIDDVNQFMNNPNNQTIDSQELWIQKLNEKYNTKNIGPLQSREYGFPSFIEKRIQSNQQEKFCLNTIRSDFIKFFGENIKKYDIDKLRVVIGHCPQNPFIKIDNSDGSSKLDILINTTMVHLLNSDSVSKTYSSKKYITALPDWKNQDTIFGITMQCPKPKKNNYTDFYIYHIDTSTSRSFDWQIYYDWITYNNSKAIELENICLFSKTPQVLLIDNSSGDDIITIIKSKMRNTRIHLPRYNYEELIKTMNIKSLNINSENYD